MEPPTNPKANHVAHTGMFECTYSKAGRTRTEFPFHHSSLLYHARLKPSTETCTKTILAVPALQQEENIRDKYGETKILREEKHMY